MATDLYTRVHRYSFAKGLMKQCKHANKSQKEIILAPVDKYIFCDFLCFGISSNFSFLTSAFSSNRLNIDVANRT